MSGYARSANPTYACWLEYSDALASCPETEIVPRTVIAKVDVVKA